MNKTILSYFFVVFAFCHSLSFTASAQDDESNQILFLHLSITETGAELIDVTLVDGRLKVHRGEQKPDNIQYKLLDVNENVLQVGYESDPINQHYEFVNDQGEYQHVDVSYEKFPLTIRVPFKKNIDRIRINRLEPSDSMTGKVRTEPQLLNEFRISDIINK
jgi:hypothetical protein